METKQKTCEVVTVSDIKEIVSAFGFWTALTFIAHRILRHETFIVHAMHGCFSCKGNKRLIIKSSEAL